jgi:hypothetical protein
MRCDLRIGDLELAASAAVPLSPGSSCDVTIAAGSVRVWPAS